MSQLICQSVKYLTSYPVTETLNQSFAMPPSHSVSESVIESEDNLALSVELIMQVGHRKELLKPAFRALALRQIEREPFPASQLL